MGHTKLQNRSSWDHIVLSTFQYQSVTVVFQNIHRGTSASNISDLQESDNGVMMLKKTCGSKIKRMFSPKMS